MRADVAKELSSPPGCSTAARRSRSGLATKLSDTPLDDAMAMAAEIAGRSPDSIRGAKALLNGLFNHGAAEQFAAERRVIGSADRPAEPGRGGDGQLREARRRRSPTRHDATMHDVDPDKLKLYSFQLFTKLEGAVTAGMIHLGDRLGLYAAMTRRAHR